MTSHRAAPRRLPQLIATAFFSLVMAGFSQPPSLEEALERIDPQAARWGSERLQGAVSERLNAIAAALGGEDLKSLDRLVPVEARASSLRADGDDLLLTHGDWSILRLRRPRSLGLFGARQMLRALPAGITGWKCHFKVIEVDWRPGRPLRTELRVEGSGRAKGELWEQVARWSVVWRVRTPDEIPQLVSITLERCDEIRRNSLFFREVTASVLTGRSGGASLLTRGGEWWPGHLDALGDFSLMGHHGIALGDANGDGLEDLYVAMPGGLPNRLYLRGPKGELRDASSEAQVAWLDDTKGVLFADMDNDGDQDLLCAIGADIVLGKNDGTGRFSRIVKMGARTPAPFYSLAVADYDGDGDLDIYACRYVKQRYGVSVPIPYHDANNGPTNHLLRNDGDDRYTDVTAKVGLALNNTRFSLAAAWGDYDGDGDPDLYVSNDFGRNNLYRNDGGRFVDVAAEAGVEDQAAGMGVSWGDYDGDGDLDLFVTNMFSSAGRRVAYQSRFKGKLPEEERRAIQGHSLGSSLFENQGRGRFIQVADSAGVRMGRWGWGARFVDLDNDGRLDIVSPNGFLSGREKDDL